MGLMQQGKNIRAVAKHGKPTNFTRNVKIIQETLIELVDVCETKEQHKECIHELFKDIVMIMKTKELKEINKDVN